MVVVVAYVVDPVCERDAVAEELTRVWTDPLE